MSNSDDSLLTIKVRPLRNLVEEVDLSQLDAAPGAR